MTEIVTTRFRVNGVWVNAVLALDTCGKCGKPTLSSLTVTEDAGEHPVVNVAPHVCNAERER